MKDRMDRMANMPKEVIPRKTGSSPVKPSGTKPRGKVGMPAKGTKRGVDRGYNG